MFFKVEGYDDNDYILINVGKNLISYFTKLMCSEMKLTEAELTRIEEVKVLNVETIIFKDFIKGVSKVM